MWRTVFRLGLVMLCVAALGFVAAPWFAFRALKSYARDGDVQGLAELVDYKSVRASLRSQITGAPARTAEPAPDILHDPIGAIKRALEPLRPAPPAVDVYVSLPALQAMTRGYDMGKAPPEPPKPQGVKAVIEDFTKDPPRLDYWGPNRVRFAASAPESPTRETVFTFQRRGWFQWQLVQITLPRKT